MKKLARAAAAVGLSLALTGCVKDSELTMASAMMVGAGVLQAATLDEKQVVKTASLSAKELDKKNKVAAPGSQYDARLQRLVRGLENADGLNLNFKVYLDKSVNAFAMPDGTVRVHSGLLDAMPDDQVLAVIGHEIGHVKLKHSYNQMRSQLLTNTAFQAAASAGGDIGALTSSQLGGLAYKAINARFSQQDELEADRYAVKFLRSRNKDPEAMTRSIETLQAKYGSGGGFLSSHPSNSQRIDNLEKTIAGQ
ncbi:M48 family metallopeptidase [Aliamphritea hakodatensis]|uniref:M48 family metallopeptidase n=1 Tax=Aliamphritea hakodatensis TaxID=2895352 RepID=UPI0022FD5A02|nr:M48 family metallopeptidase [Aliamphritea hakodatensis]